MHGYNLRSVACLLALAVCTALVTQTGCNSFLITALYFTKGTAEPAKYKGLKDKCVAVVCKPSAAIEYSAGPTPDELATEVGALLKQKVRGIKIVDPAEVASWTDENNSIDFLEIGKELKADMVLAIELETFGLQQGQTVYQGRSQVRLKVLDVSQEAEKEVVWKISLPDLVYPPNSPIPAQERDLEAFRQEYIKVLAAEIGRNFYPYEPSDRYARDAEAYKVRD